MGLIDIHPKYEIWEVYTRGSYSGVLVGCAVRDKILAPNHPTHAEPWIFYVDDLGTVHAADIYAVELKKKKVEI